MGLFAVTKIPPKAPFQSQLSRIELPVKPDAGQHPFTCRLKERKKDRERGRERERGNESARKAADSNAYLR